MRQIETTRKRHLPSIASSWSGRFRQVSSGSDVGRGQPRGLAKLNPRGGFSGPGREGGRIGGPSAARTRPLTFSRDRIAWQSGIPPRGCATAQVTRHFIAHAIRIFPYAAVAMPISDRASGKRAGRKITTQHRQPDGWQYSRD